METPPTTASAVPEQNHLSGTPEEVDPGEVIYRFNMADLADESRYDMFIKSLRSIYKPTTNPENTTASQEPSTFARLTPAAAFGLRIVFAEVYAGFRQWVVDKPEERDKEGWLNTKNRLLLKLTSN